MLTNLLKVLLNKEPRMTFDPNSTYLISGGLGGLGRDIASWMVRCGVRHLVLLSRFGPRAQTESFVKSLRDQGVELATPACDITREDEIKAALEKCAAMPPIRGCIQAAVVMEVGHSSITASFIC
jgi:NAD(P)-dependent dehydrogenase (short-subunit alcohol dehydrogenase family)